MTLKTILVHLANDDHHRARLDVALRLARRHGAHLVALFITFPVGMPAAIAGRGASAAYIAEAREAAHRHARELEAEFSGACGKAGITWTWVVEEGEHLDALARHAHVADLTVVSKSAPEQYLEDHFRARLAEELVLVSGTPVLLLPRVSEVPGFGRNIMVAWRPSREAVRALRDALPFLKEAARVSVVTVGDTPADQASEREAVDFLRRHAVTAEPVRFQGDSEAGEHLLTAAKELGADLLIMGAYGRSRLREVLFGGTTRHVLRHLELPVMMSH